MKKPQISSHPRVGDRGFALIVTLSLMILLTIVAVGLLTLSSISLRASVGSAAMVEARQNARMGLMLAIGELQKYAGPDQRITATADIAGDAAGLPLAAGAQPGNDKSINGISKGLSTVQPGTRYWTGVWKNANTSPTPAVELYTRTPSPQFVRWLISGSETGSGSSNNPSSAICAVGSNGAVADAEKAVVLVGRETAGDPSANTISRYVAAPLIPIAARTGSPGQTSGRYGWWIGDEGVKASINIAKTNDDNTSYASLSAQRRGWEAIDGLEDYPTPSSAGHDSLAKVITLPEAALLVSNSAGSSGGATPLQSIFHSATADSRGVIVDTLSGGTKIDLTAILSGTLPSSPPLGTITNYPVRNTNIIPRLVSSTLVAPKWDTLKEFFDRHKSLQGDSLIVKAASSAATASIAPLITDLRILMGVRFRPASNGSGAAGYKANACGKIAIAIANPYSKTLKWNTDLEIEVRNLTPYPSSQPHPNGRYNSPSRIWSLGANSVFISSNESAVFNQAIFRISAASLAPGEARAYTNAGHTLRAIGTGTQRTVIDLAPFSSANPTDFTKCVELDAAGVYTSFSGLDVRERWQTTLVGLVMRLAGGSSGAEPLRRIEGFELDNGYYYQNIRNPDMQYCAARPNPIGLMCFSFQVSQPGWDYLEFMPAGYEMGQRASTLRTFADFNLQATRISKAITSYNPPPYFMESNNGFGQLADDGQTGRAFTKNLDSPMPWGRTFDTARNTARKTVLFSVPSQFTSLAQFQHADLTGDDIAASLGHQPGNAFANSYATPFVKRSLVIQPRIDYVIKGWPEEVGAIETPRNYYDISYLLNTAVWDSYFLSTVAGSSSDGTPEYPSLVRVNPNAASSDLSDPVMCASQLMIDGAFNVNCTDKNAWKAFLASSKHFQHKTGASANAAFPRSLEQPSPSAIKATGTADDSFSGFRRLSDTELDDLATELTRQVRIRGPFVSLSHFVNRALRDISASSAPQPELTRCGALQSAIDESGININFAGNKKGLTGIVANADRVTLAEKNNAPRADLDGGDTSGQFPVTSPPVWAVTSADNNYGSVASIIADRTMLNSAKGEQGYRSTGIPGWLTQADVLQVIGPSISNRSDTFRIRAYGESLDAAGKTLAKAYCEAILQRVPDYVDPSNAPSDRGVSLTALNLTYGRKFTLTSFRWLSLPEI